MKGTMLIYKVDATAPEIVAFVDAAPTLDDLQKAVEGDIQTVPEFDHIRINGERHTAWAICNEDGKVKEMPVNKLATLLWEQIAANKGLKLRDAKGDFLDVLVGPVAVLYGDKEFMEEL